MRAMRVSGVRLRLAAVLMGCGSLALPAAALAQAQPPKQEATGELAFVGTTGNSSTRTFSGGIDYIARPRRWLFRTRFQAIHGESAHVVTAESWLYVARAERVLSARASTFGEYIYFRDQRAGVVNRNTASAGLTMAVIKSSRQTLNTDAGFGYLNEVRITGLNRSSATYSGAAVYKVKISDTATLSNEFRLLGTFTMPNDWRLSNLASVQARLNSYLSLKFSSVVRYVHTPPARFKTTDTTTSMALVATFKSKPPAKK